MRERSTGRALLLLLTTAIVAIVIARARLAAALMLDDLPPGAVYTVRAIRIEENATVSDRTIRKTMLTHVRPLWAPWRRKEVFNPSLFRTDLERIRTLLRESGHFQSEVTYELEPEEDALAITLHVDEGPAAKIEAVELRATDFTIDRDEDTALRAQLQFAPGSVFNQAAYDESRARLQRYYLERGYAYVEVEKSAIVDTAASSVRVTYAITRRAPAVFGATAIAGTKTVGEYLVRREVRWKSGDPYDPRKVEETQAAVFGLRLFRSATVKPSNLEAQSGTVDMAIDVSEGPPREVQLGAGYGLEDGPRGQVRWQHNNFYGGGRQLGVRVKASSIQQAIESEFRQPYFLHPRQTLVVPLTEAREDEPAFTLTRIRLAPQVERKFGRTLRVVLGYNLEYDDVSEIPGNTSDLLEEFKPRGYVSSLTGVIERNTTVDLLDPHDGSVLNLTAEQAGGPWAGDFTFYRALFEAKRYVPVLGTRVVAGRFRIGAADAFGQSQDVPIFRRFFAGGINSTRGYGRWLVGPLNAADSPIGGRSLLEGSLEFRTPVYKQLGGVVFVDVGEVEKEPFVYGRHLQFGVGFGARYQTVVGPLRVDLGFPLERPAGQAGWQVHFSIGQAF